MRGAAGGAAGLRGRGAAMADPPAAKRTRTDDDVAAATPSSPKGLSEHMSSVILIEVPALASVARICPASTPVESPRADRTVSCMQVTCASPNYLQPWQMHPQQSAKGSGFIIEGNRILTNFHVVQASPSPRVCVCPLSPTHTGAPPARRNELALKALSRSTCLEVSAGIPTTQA